MRGTSVMRAREFWTPEYWRRYCESANPFRQYKQERDRSLAIELLKPRDALPRFFSIIPVFYGRKVLRISLDGVRRIGYLPYRTVCRP